MVWMISIFLLLSFGYNVYQYWIRRRPRTKGETNQNGGLNQAIDQIGRSGSALPDLSLDLTTLAASNLKSVEAFRGSSNDLQSILSTSINRFHEIDDMGRKNINSIEQRINDLKSFINSIEELNDHNRSVEETVHILEDISSQTSMLALNASVEAARAGSQGKGFAVIARSVRELASRSMAASEAIKDVTNRSREQGQIIADRVLESSKSLEEIFENINQIIQSLNEGRSAFEENSAIVDGIVNSANELDTTVHRNLDAVRETSHIGIKLGIHLGDLYARSRSQIQSGVNFEFIKPQHVFHFNFTNTLPCLSKLTGISSEEIRFPEEKNPKILPSDVYKQLFETSNVFRKSASMAPLEAPHEFKTIEPIDVLKLSVLFCESVQRKSGMQMPDKQLVMRYDDWKNGREITPSDVLSLVSFFDAAVRRYVRINTKR